MSKFIAINPRNGLHLRPATEAEVAEYLEQPVRHPSFRTAVKVGDILIDEDAVRYTTGTGVTRNKAFSAHLVREVAAS
jgi:hypothetical protein